MPFSHKKKKKTIRSVKKTKKVGQNTQFFGIDEGFVGMAVIINTNRVLLSKNRKEGEPMGRHRDVSIVLNNGTRTYHDLIGNLEGCTANVRFDESRDDFNVMMVSDRAQEPLIVCTACPPWPVEP